MSLQCLKVIFFAIVHAEKIGHYGRVIKLSQTFLETANGSGGSNGKVNDISFKKYINFLSLFPIPHPWLSISYVHFI